MKKIDKPRNYVYLITCLLILASIKSFSQYGTLKIVWVGVIDNGEGDDWPHGPTGNFHILIYPAHVGCLGDQKSYDNTGYLGENRVLKGPWYGDSWYDLEDVGLDFGVLGAQDYHGEWKDGDAMLMNFSVYKWRSPNDRIIILIYESDPGGAGRCHDCLFCYEVDRNSTFYLTTLMDDYRPAHDDAIMNCRKRGVTWPYQYWRNGLNRGIPSIFLQVQTVM